MSRPKAPPLQNSPVSMLNALTIDVEDYYHVGAFASVIRPADWGQYESRVERNVHRLLDLLDAYQTRGTFFVLGWVAERNPRMLRAVHARGHEVASHGYAHQLIYTQTPDQFREETHRSKGIIEDAIGQLVIGYRAASYSITKESLWALRVLEEEGFRYDSSIFPVHHDRYGIPGSSRFCHPVDGQGGEGLVEFPPSTVRFMGVNLPVAGGGYFRIFPYVFTRWAIKHLNHKEYQPAVVYLHPWEIDPEQPRIRADALSRFRHYCNLMRTETRLQRLLREFTFGPMCSVLEGLGFLKHSGDSVGSESARNGGSNSLARDLG
jgi:polysaccharide deacetylase family protein (PEP-CTERM system associated)